MLDQDDRQAWVDALGRFGWQVWAYCLMDNHYQLLVETPQANLSRGMRELNDQYGHRHRISVFLRGLVRFSDTRVARARSGCTHDRSPQPTR